jgi:aspartyl-tRNA(Asn)/glutamyl-tRNA(Gln) amidotransferase subunit A
MRVEEAMHRPIEEVAEAIRIQAISPVELTAAYLDRIGEKDGQLKGFIHVAADALNQAGRLAAAAKEGRTVGPLHGIPLAIKDNYLTADMPTRAGTEATIEFPNVEGIAVRKLREAGAILLGKTRMHEFAWGMETPPARNPFDTDRVPGGSSGGSGIAVAAGARHGGARLRHGWFDPHSGKSLRHRRLQADLRPHWAVRHRSP